MPATPGPVQRSTLAWKLVSLGAPLCALLGVACVGSTAEATAGPEEASDAGASGTSEDAHADARADVATEDAASPFKSAPHAPPALLSLHTTKVLAAPQVVTVSFAGFAKQDAVESFGDFVVASQWLTTAGSEYGVGQGSHVAKARLTAAAPAKVTDTQIVSLLQARIADGTLPAPGATNAELVFLVYFPQGTTIDDGTGTIMCLDDYSGYHASAKSSGTSFGYAVLPDCDGKIDSLTSTASHELIEAATDPIDAWSLDVPKTDPWWGLQGAEVGDLCEWTAVVREGPWALQRSWSNAAAAAGQNPCVPAQPGASTVMTGVTAAPSQVVALKPGAKATFTLTGWSTARVADFPLHTVITDGADFDPQATLSAATINNGGTVTVTLTVPATNNAGKPVKRGQMGSTLIYSGPDFDSFSPITVVVP